jgi:hypothetical protein
VHHSYGETHAYEVLLVWEISSGKLVQKLNNVSRSWDKGYTFRVGALAFNEDGTRLASLDTLSGTRGSPKKDSSSEIPHFMIWDWRNGILLKEGSLPKEANAYRSRLQWHSNGSDLIIQTPSKTLAIEVESNKLIHEYPGCATLMSDGNSLITYTKGAVQILSYPAGNIFNSFNVGNYEDIGETCISPNGRWFAGTLNKASFLLADLVTKTQIAPSEGHQNKPYWIVYSPNGKLIVHDGGSAKIYDDDTSLKTADLPISFYRIDAYPAISKDGRIMIASGKENGKAEVWDLWQGKMTGKLSPHKKGAIEKIWLSSNNSLALTMGEYDGTALIHDLLNNKVLGSFTGPKQDFFGYMMHLSSCRWNESGSLMMLGDTTGEWFHEGDQDEMKKNNLKHPLGFTGGFDAHTGNRLYWFQDEKGNPIESASFLEFSEADDLVILVSGTKYGLFKGSDGSFVRWIDPTGIPTLFSDDHRRLVGPNALVDIKTGKALQDFTKSKLPNRVISPSGTYIACFDENKILLLDSRTGVEVWESAISRKEIEEVRIDSLLWHPAETQVSMTLKDCPAVFQIDLFPNFKKNTTLQKTAPSLTSLFEDLKSIDPNSRQTAIVELVKEGDSALDDLCKLLKEKSVTPNQIRLAIHVLEWQTREGKDSARKLIEELSRNATNEVVRGCTEDALIRLKALTKVRQLAGKT